MNDKNIISEINRSLEETYIHYNPDRVEYTASESEINELEHCGNSTYKDIFLASLGIGIPTSVNAILGLSEYSKNKNITLELFINCLISCLCVFLCFIFFIFWRNNSKKYSDLITHIKNKPKYKVPKQNTKNRKGYKGK
jgi:hypothetical protein